MDFQTIETEALHLSREERTRLIKQLVLSLDTPSKEELRDDWLREAQRRATEWDEGVIQPTPGDEVLKKARALIR